MLNQICDFLAGGANLLIFVVLLPSLFGILTLLFPNRYALRMTAAILASALNLLFALSLYSHDEFSVYIPYISEGFEFTLHVYWIPSIFLLLTAALFFLLSVYTVASLKEEKSGGWYLLLLFISLSMVNGAILSDSLGIMLFFGEGLFGSLAVILLINKFKDTKMFTKTLTISGLANLLLMFGIMVTEHTAGTGSISEFTKLSLSGEGLLGFLCMTLGALGLIACMPFHIRISDAAENTPTIFMAAFPGFFMKIFGGLFLTNIFLYLYDAVPLGKISILLIVLGALTANFIIEKVMVFKRIFKSEVRSRLDPYNWFLYAIGLFSELCFLVERGVSWLYDKGIPGLVTGTGFALHKFDNGHLSRYLSLTVAGTVIIAVIFLVIYL